MSGEKKFVIIDGNAIVHRAYHALPPLTAKDGTMINAVYGFTSMLLKVMADLKPDYIAVSFDVAGGTFRDKVYKDYKATRVRADQELYDQIPLCYKIVEAFNIPIYVKPGYEADDVIGTVTKILENKNPDIENIVVTGDMDLLQIVGKNTKVYALRKGMSDIVMYDSEEVKKKYGFGPERIVDYKALRGDTSDNIPGVNGIGEKTAVELITKFGGINEIYKNYKEDSTLKPGVVKKLEEDETNAFMSHELATIIRDVPDLDFKLENCITHEFDINTVADLFKKFEFFSMLKRIPGYTQKDTSTEQQTNIKKTKAKKLVVADKNNIENIIKELENENIIACKEVLNGKNILDGELVGIVFSTAKNNYYIEKPSRDIFKIFQDKNKIIVGHDLKQLVKVLRCCSVDVFSVLFDVMIASYLINSSNRNHDLRSIALRELGIDLPTGSDQSSLFGVDPNLVARELDIILQIYSKQKKALEEESDIGLFNNVEMKLIPILADMELNGIAVDVPVLNQLSKDVAKAIDKVTKKIYKEAGEEFNVASSTQLRDILFEKMGLPAEGIKKGKTGYSTAESELDKLSGIHPIIDMIREHRELAKLQSTYVDVLPKLINPKTNRIHTTFNQAVTTTGRLSSSDPNLQNIPIRTELGKEIRNAFIAEPGNVLVVADYSQIELRIVASLARDEKMIEIFKQNKDIHTATAAVINGVKLEKVTKEMRRAAKEVNFGVLYGMGAFGLASRTGITNWEAKDFIKKYFENFSGVKKYLDDTLKLAHKDGYVETLFGRKRYVPELQSDNFQLRNAGERMAINMPIQGTAADLMKMAMIEIDSQLTAQSTQFPKDKVKMILQVHDEIVLEVEKSLAEDVGKIVKEAMENVVKLNVPVEVHVDIGTRWGELK
ncbi:MAG: DNA polymerase I [Candidatus Magasanikiibacteriota bacterium]